MVTMQTAAIQFSQAMQGLATVGLVSLLIAHFLIAMLALVSVFRSTQSAGMKLVWFVLVWLAPLVGSVLWFLIGRHDHRARWQRTA
jgi:Phospholipase_D-nuclease N-terminal